MSTLVQRFWAKVSVRGPDECWPWLAGQNGDGYGLIRVGPASAGSVLAHRVAYELHYGPVPIGLNVLHTCDFRACCNPRHLFVGTQSNNLLDASQKGRLAHRNYMRPRGTDGRFTRR